MRTVLINETKDVVATAASGTIVTDINLSDFERFHLDAIISSLGGGTAPTVVFTIQRKDQFTFWRDVWASAALSAAGQGIQRSFGPGMDTPCLPNGLYRIRWTTTGVPTTCTVSVALFGDADL